MYTNEEGYLYLLEDTISEGIVRPSRVGPTFSRFAPDNLVFDLREGFPILTTRKIFWRPIIGELAAFLIQAVKVEQFQRLGCNYWNDDAERWGKNGYLGRIYGVQWRDFNGHIDQLEALVTGLVQDPYGRRHIVTAWHPGELKDMCLPPCHIFFQCYVRPEDKALDLMVYMRSVDLCLGLPADLVLYGALQHLIAKEVGLIPGTLTFQFGDAHIYTNHTELAMMQIKRRPQPRPQWELNYGSLFNFDPTGVHMVDYKCDEGIPYKLNTVEVSL